MRRPAAVRIPTNRSRAMRPMRHFLVLAVGLAVGLLIISSAQGAEPEEGTRLFCDTPAQIERAVEFRDKGLEWSAVGGRVNAAEASACAVLYFRYERLEKVKQVSSSRGPGEIVKVRILKVAVRMVFIVG